MKLKNVLLMGLSLVLVAALAIGGTVAFLSDSDSDVNVMTLGNVKIEQIEQERDAEGNLVAFKQGKPALPAVYDGTSIPWADAGKWPVPNDSAWKVVEDNANVVDKFVSVKNTGKSDAFVRTIIAFEAGKDKIGEPYMHFVCNDSSATLWDFEWVTENGEDVTINIDDSVYYIGVFTYREALKPGVTTVPNVKQVYLDKEATNEICAAYGDTFEILVLSQAVQADGFQNAATALDTAFGALNNKNAAEWFNGMIVHNGATFSNPGEYEINKAIIFENETGDNIVANKEGVVVNVNGGYYDTGSQRNNCAVWAYNGGTININDGYFIADGDAAPATSASHLDLIYAGQGGTINIYGGTFSLRNNNGWLLNEKDDTATITVYGGSFLNWNPADNVSEGANTNFVAEGYEVKTETTAEGTWYHVVPVE